MLCITTGISLFSNYITKFNFLGTSVNVRDFSGRTPLHMAAYRGLSDIMFLLLENRGDVNARDHQVRVPFRMCSHLAYH